MKDIRAEANKPYNKDSMYDSFCVFDEGELKLYRKKSFVKVKEEIPIFFGQGQAQFLPVPDEVKAEFYEAYPETKGIDPDKARMKHHKIDNPDDEIFFRMNLDFVLMKLYPEHKQILDLFKVLGDYPELEEWFSINTFTITYLVRYFDFLFSRGNTIEEVFGLPKDAIDYIAEHGFDRMPLLKGYYLYCKEKGMEYSIDAFRNQYCYFIVDSFRNEFVENLEGEKYPDIEMRRIINNIAQYQAIDKDDIIGIFNSYFQCCRVLKKKPNVYTNALKRDLDIAYRDALVVMPSLKIIKR